MSGSKPRPFTFDTVFQDDGRVVQPVRPKTSFTLEEVDRIRAECRAEGERSASARAAQAQATALAQIAEAARGALAGLAQVAHDHRAGSAKLALAAANKIADAALAAFPQAPVQAALAALAREVEAVPRLLCRAAPDQIQAVQAALTEAAASAGYPGQILARPDTSLISAAFVLDWGDGSAAFDPVQAAGRVAQALDTALAAEGLHAEPLSPFSLNAAALSAPPHEA